MRRLALLIVLALASAVAPAGTAAAATIDQEQPQIDTSAGFVFAIGGGSEQKLAQVVTPGLTGLLTEVRFSAACVTDLKVEVQGVTDGVPNGTVLGSQTVPFPVPFPLSFRGIPFASPVPVAAGVPYALVLTTPDSCGIWPGPVGNPYSGGDAYFDSRPNAPGVWVPLSSGRSDLPFQTLVDATHDFALILAPQSALNDVGSTHTVTATLTDNGRPVGGARILFSADGSTTPTPSQSADTDSLGNASFTYVGNAVGLDVITACYDADNDGVCQDDELKQRVDTQWVDRTPPGAECIEAAKPANGPRRAGFYRLLAFDNTGVASIVVRDSGSDFVSMEFAGGDEVRITQAPGVVPRDRRPGPGGTASHLLLKGDAILRVTDTSGNVTETPCEVTPPPK